MLMDLYGVYLGIFADDVCLFTSGLRREPLSDAAEDPNNRILDGLQEGILFIQWYSLVTGLLLNYAATGNSDVENVDADTDCHGIDEEIS